MNPIIFLFILSSIASQMIALEKDTLAKKEKINIYIGLGINSNLIKTNNFHYHYDPQGYDDVMKDYDISIKRVCSPSLEIELNKKIFRKGKFNISVELKDMVWMTQEKYGVKGTEDGSTVDNVLKNISRLPFKLAKYPLLFIEAAKYLK